MEYPSSCQTFGNQYYEKTKRRKQPSKLQHHQTESAKVRNRVWFRTGPNSKSTNQERPQNISILCKHIIPDTHSHTLPDDGRSISRNVAEKHYDSRHDKLRNNMDTTESTNTNIFKIKHFVEFLGDRETTVVFQEMQSVSTSYILKAPSAS